jgi:hypothetical protein
MSDGPVQGPPVVFDDRTKLFTEITSKEHLNAWCDKFLGFTLPDCKVTDYADSTPLDFVYECYRAIMDGQALNIIGLSGRDTAKTVSLSIIDLLAMLHDERDAIHIGMISRQAQRAREYLEAYILKNPLIKPLVTKQNTKELRMKLTPESEEIGLELISLDPKQVQGAHKSVVSFDELASSVDPVKMKAYRDASGIPGSSKKGKPAVIIKITSRQTGNTIPEVEIKNAHKTGLKIRKWTTIDCMKQCPPERSGTTPHPMYINLIKGIVYDERDFAALPFDSKDGFSLAPDIMDKCLSCPLMMYCQGKARYQKSDSLLLRSIDDVIHKVNTSGSHEWVLAQLMSLQPSQEGLVYPEFNPEIHIPSFEALWETLTGEKAGFNVNRQMFIKELKRRGAYFYGGVDWGYTNPATCIVIAVDKKDNVYVVEAAGAVRKNDVDWTNYIVTEIQTKYDVQMYCPDTENPSGISIMKGRGLPVAHIDKGPGTVRSGINSIKGLLRLPGTNNSTRIYFLPDIKPMVMNHPGLIEEFGLYAYNVDAAGNIQDDKNPAKGSDHHLDGLRYVLFWLYGKTQVQTAFTNLGAETVYSHTPTSDDLARMQGITFNDNRHEFGNMGYQPDDPTKPDDDPDGAPPAGGGGLSVSWT